MVREFQLADLFTLGNAVCGTASLFAVVTYAQDNRPRWLLLACLLIVVALAFDILDGRIARWRQQQSSLGRELDSLSDIISFGVAPAALAFASGMDGLWDQLLLLYFVACGVSRLARFNVTAEVLSAGQNKVKYFEGTPIPTSVLLVGVLAWCAAAGRTGTALPWGVHALGPAHLHPLVILFGLSGSLMISKTIRIPKI